MWYDDSLYDRKKYYSNELARKFDYSIELRTKENFYQDNSKILIVPGLPNWKMKVSNIRAFDNFMENNSDFVRNSISFTVIRNPWDRFISSWEYCKYKSRTRYFKDKSIKDILLNPPTLEDDWFSYWHLTKTQSSTMKFKNKIIGKDYVIRFENLQEDFNKLCDKIGYERMELPHLNKTKHKEYWEYFDPETNDIFMERYGDDVENLGYTF